MRISEHRPKDVFTNGVPTVALLLAVMILPCIVQANPPAGTNWTMTFSDEFDGTTLDLAKWDTTRFGEHSDHDELYLGRNCVVHDGMVSLTMKREKIPGTTCDAGTCNFTSGAITTRFTQQYGYWEMSAKFPKGVGFWPAFWLLASNPETFEIDIMEWWGNNEGYDMALHLWSNGQHLGETGGSYTPGVDMTAGYHQYGCRWARDAANTMYMYFDDKLVATLRSPLFQGQTIPPLPALMNLQNGDIPASTVLPGSYDIEWVRIYKEGSTAARGAQMSDLGRSQDCVRIARSPNGTATVSLSTNGPCEVRITGMDGKVVKVLTVNGSSAAGVNMRDVSPGIYTVQANGNGFSQASIAYLP